MQMGDAAPWAVDLVTVVTLAESATRAEVGDEAQCYGEPAEAGG